MLTVTAYATPAAKAPFEKTTIDRRDLGPRDVLIKIAFAGICHSDIHTGREEWGAATFPLVPGHEIAGMVQEVGTEVDKFGSATGSASVAWWIPAASARTAWPARSSTA